MARVLSALGNFVTGFLAAFVVVSIIKDRKSGVRAGLVWGLVSAIASWVFGGMFSPPEDLGAPPEGRTFDEPETTD